MEFNQENTSEGETNKDKEDMIEQETFTPPTNLPVLRRIDTPTIKEEPQDDYVESIWGQSVNQRTANAKVPDKRSSQRCLLAEEHWNPHTSPDMIEEAAIKQEVPDDIQPTTSHVTDQEFMHTHRPAPTHSTNTKCSSFVCDEKFIDTREPSTSAVCDQDFNDPSSSVGLLQNQQIPRPQSTLDSDQQFAKIWPSTSKFLTNNQERRNIQPSPSTSLPQVQDVGQDGPAAPQFSASLDKQYKCDECSYSCEWKSDYLRHLMTHSGEKPFQCVECDYSTSYRNNLDTHMRTHSGEKPYKCGECDYSCSRKGYLKIHNRIHTGDKPFKCTECDFSSTENSSLIKHKRKHTGEKPYKCDECDFSCSQKGYLKVHKRKHSGERPYLCDECDYTCKSNANLMRHKKMHARSVGSKNPFVCVECGYSAAHKCHLTRHRSIVHGEPKEPKQ